MTHLLHLRAIQIFEAAARLGSFLRAADELRVTPSAVSHQIRSLETTLGVQLFHRINRAVMLTDVGRKYADEVSEALGRIEAASQTVARKGKSDILTIHSVPSFASQWLMPRLSRFGALNPEIDLRLNASGDAADLGGDAVDIDIRYGTFVPAAYLGVDSFPLETIVVLCSPKLMKGASRIRTPADIKKHVLIHSEVNLYRWKHWADDAKLELDLERGPRFDRSFMAISTAVDGLGVCLESRLLVQRELESGRLVMPFGPNGARMLCHSLVYRRSRTNVPKIATFRKWMSQALRETET
ncbi:MULTISPECIES: transcriptional regulator GcvA [Bradyrhizobium]|uniref:LysR family transcriptional regulator n=1 Tax=Bradyrhizobium zhanjiangense TaxID=1325107 RepID=A0A4Q0SU20_9BRAD|nr:MULTISPECIES: transcriptional regulator GcvA [Bradyrhizobium]MBB4380392.1 LysR family glycine cleavage system transcriptional activator [Bradyrhizobium sp. SBR1B]RXH41506.1 LysR family transcriptional regulator [Bradyrhizobium zhanjiangense]